MIGKRLLMIPGPIEFTPEVLAEMAKPTLSHTDPQFIEEFGQALEKMRKVWLAPNGQPFIIAGSGTLAMEIAAVNITEPGDNVLILHTGYFSERMADIFKLHGANVDIVQSTVGDLPQIDEVRKKLASKKYKTLSITHVDTSTGVRADVKALAAAAQETDTLVVVDGVCAVAGEELRMEEWGVDIAFTASQKAIGVPPGLALLVASKKAIEAFKSRKSPVGAYYCDWQYWLPVMEAYEGRKSAYFGTPAVNLVRALNISLGQILDEGMEARFARHARNAAAFRAGLSAIGLGFVPMRKEIMANTLSAVYYPEGTDASILPLIAKNGAMLAGGLLPAIKTKYFRIGHMGMSDASEILATLGAIEQSLSSAGYSFEPGASLSAAQAALMQP
ncbi:MAG TPA: alanine--glyoxylate aminotransferase family protein [Rectinema sp.]|nr:alanine--glyoxylate aminotransferase family protein [Rectinema sp.]